MDYVNVWLYACASLVSLVAGWNFIKILGWKKDLVFYLTRELAKGNGMTRGIAMWPAFITDIVLLPAYAFCALSKGTIEKNLEIHDRKACEANKSHWTEKWVGWIQEDLNNLRQDVENLSDAFIADECGWALEDRVKELEIEITRVDKRLIYAINTSELVKDTKEKKLELEKSQYSCWGKSPYRNKIQ